jgi:hypothetical protein
MGKHPNVSNLKCERKTTSNKAMYTLYKQKYKINCNKTTVYQAITTPLYINLYLYTSMISITVQSSPVPIPSPYQQANSYDQHLAHVLPSSPNLNPLHGE